MTEFNLGKTLESQATSLSEDITRRQQTENPRTGLNVSNDIQNLSKLNSSISSLNNVATGNWILNPLSNVHQPAYHFTFLMLNDSDSNNVLKNGSTDISNGIVIAESGATGYNILSVRMSNLVSPSQKTRNVSMTKIEMELYEPYGVSLLDQILSSADILGIKNYHKAPFFLQLKFHGYDSSGNIIDNIATTLEEKKTWLYALHTTKVSTELSAGGTKYRFEFIPYHFKGITNQFGQLNENKILLSATVGDAFKALEEEMLRHDEFHYGHQRHKYKFVVLPLPQSADVMGVGSSDPSSWKLKNKEMNQQGIRTAHLKVDGRGPKIFSFASLGDSIESFTEALMGKTEEAQKIAARNDDPNVPSNKAENTVIWSIYSQTVINEERPYDPDYNDYNYDLTWYIIPSITPQSILDRDEQFNQAKDKSKGSTRVQKYKQRILRKKYDYIFTGLNTEVYDFDMKFDFAWYAMVPRMAKYASSSGQNNNLPAGPVASASGGQAIIGQKQLEIIKGIQEGRQALSDIQKKISNLKGTADRVTDQSSQLFGQLQSIGQSLLQKKDQLLRLQEDARNTRLGDLGITGSSNFKYVEDISVNTNAPVPFSFEKDNTASQVESSRDLESDINAGRTVFGLLLNQQYSLNSDGGLNRLNLRIKGDPYWLGFTTTDIQYTPKAYTYGSQAPMPVYWAEEQMVAVHFKYPVKVNNNGDPELRSSDVFSGIFAVYQVESEFSDGKFTQTLTGARNVNVTIDPKILDQ